MQVDQKPGKVEGLQLISDRKRMAERDDRHSEHQQIARATPEAEPPGNVGQPHRQRRGQRHQQRRSDNTLAHPQQQGAQRRQRGHVDL